MKRQNILQSAKNLKYSYAKSLKKIVYHFNKSYNNYISPYLRKNKEI